MLELANGHAAQLIGEIKESPIVDRSAQPRNSEAEGDAPAGPRRTARENWQVARKGVGSLALQQPPVAFACSFFPLSV
jgi:hypothetical protein